MDAVGILKCGGGVDMTYYYAYKVAPGKPYYITDLTFIDKKNRNDIQLHERNGWIIDKTNPQSNLVTDSSGAQTLIPIINKIIEKYNKRVLDSVLNKEKLSPYPSKPNNIVLNLNTKQNILHNIIETEAAAGGYDPDERKLIKSEVVKRIANLIIPNANTPAGNGNNNNPSKKGCFGKACNVVTGWFKSKTHGGSRTRRAKSRRAKSRRVRRTRRS